MTPKQKLEQMLDYTNEFLKENHRVLITTENPNNFVIRTSDGTQKGLILLNRQIPIRELEPIYRSNLRSYGQNVCVFYKDGKVFFRRMVENNAWRSDKSLKKYSEKEINEIISLTIQERNALFDFNSRIMENFSASSLKGRKLAYYQPKTERLSEELINFEPGIVSLDYSHIEEGQQGYGFAKESDSKLYFFLKKC